MSEVIGKTSMSTPRSHRVSMTV